MCFIIAPFLYGQEKGVGRFYDNISLKTNAFEWLITVPNFGVEYDVVRTKYDKMSINLTAKYNWNSYHKLTPSTAFDLLDVRPEFRYYLRTRTNKFTKQWWAMYLGPYLSYGNYTFKFAPEGIHGYAVGAGVSAGYVCPLYEYKKGAVDVEFGLSLGLQGCTKDVFTYNPEGYYYTRSNESRGMHFTPYPVVSELKVAFVWRKQSIAHQVKIYEQKNRYNEALKKATDAYMKLIPYHTSDEQYMDGDGLKDFCSFVRQFEETFNKKLIINSDNQYETLLSYRRGLYMDTLEPGDTAKFKQQDSLKKARLENIARKEAWSLIQSYNSMGSRAGLRKQARNMFEDAIDKQLGESVLYDKDGLLIDTTTFYKVVEAKASALKKDKFAEFQKRYRAIRKRHLQPIGPEDSLLFDTLVLRACAFAGNQKRTVVESKFNWYISAYAADAEAKAAADAKAEVKPESPVVVTYAEYEKYVLKPELEKMVDSRVARLKKMRDKNYTSVFEATRAGRLFKKDVRESFRDSLVYDSKGHLIPAAEFNRQVDSIYQALSGERSGMFAKHLEKIQKKYTPMWCDTLKENGLPKDSLKFMSLKHKLTTNLKKEIAGTKESLQNSYARKAYTELGATRIFKMYDERITDELTDRIMYESGGQLRDSSDFYKDLNAALEILQTDTLEELLQDLKTLNENYSSCLTVEQSTRTRLLQEQNVARFKRNLLQRYNKLRKQYQEKSLVSKNRKKS